MNQPTARRVSPWLAAAVALVVYANALANGFALDDEAIVAHNALVHSLFGFRTAWSSIYWPNTAGNIGLYRPVTIASYVLDWAVWNGHAFGFHLVNIGLHAAVSAAVVVLMLRLGASATGALLGGLLFAVHPVHVEAVGGVVGRAELLMTLLVLGACLVHLAHERPRMGRRLTIAALYLIALLAKESAIALPALLVIVDGLDPARDESLSRRVIGDAPLYLLLAGVLGAYLVLRYNVLGVFGGTNVAAGLEGASVATRVATAIRVWPEYVRLMIFPRDLVADYGPNVIAPAAWNQAAVWADLLLGVVIVVSAWTLRRRAPWWTGAVAWFVASMFIVSNLVVPVGIVLAERNLYLPSIALALAVAPIPVLIARRRRAVLALATVVLLMASARTWTRTPTWRSTTTVLATLASTHPEAFRAQSYLGDVAMHRGQPQNAVSHYDSAYRMVRNPVIGESYSLALIETRDWSAAERVAGESCSIEYPSPCLYLIDALLAQGKPAQARLVVDSIAPHVASSAALTARVEAVARELAKQSP